MTNDSKQPTGVTVVRTAQDEPEQVIGDVLAGTAYREVPVDHLTRLLANAVHALLDGRDPRG